MARLGLSLAGERRMRLFRLSLWCLGSLLAWSCNCGGPPIRPSLGLLTVSPTELDFGNLEKGNSVLLPIDLTNEGLGGLIIERATIEPFGVYSTTLATPLQMAAGQTVQAAVRFASEGLALGDHRATLELSLAGAAESRVTVAFRGRVVEPTLADSGTDGGTSASDSGTSTPDGGRFWIAFDSNRSGGTRDLFAVRSDGTDLIQLTNDPSTEMQPSFSPEGTQLAFASDRSDFTLQIYVMDLASRRITQITDAGTGSSQPAWSPDGTRLAFARDIGIYTIATDGTDERLVMNGLNALNAYRFPSYLPTGQWLIMSRTNQIDMIRPDGTGLRQVIQNTTTTIEAPSVAPSGAQLVFAVFCGGGFSLRSAPTATRSSACRDASLIASSGRRPAWGPLGIVYETDSSTADIEFVPAAGGLPVRVVQHPADDRNPSWAPVQTILP
jgi:Tol biopolymer transport system component